MTTPPLVSPFGGQPPPPPQQQQQQQQPQQTQARDVNTASLCRIGQETVQDIVIRTMEIFQLLRNMQVCVVMVSLPMLLSKLFLYTLCLLWANTHTHTEYNHKHKIGVKWWIHWNRCHSRRHLLKFGFCTSRLNIKHKAVPRDRGQ